MTQLQPLRQFMADEAAGRGQSGQGFLGFLLSALHRHQDVGGFAIRNQLDLGYIDQANPGIAQLAFQDGFDLLAQGLAQPLAAISQVALLRHGPTNSKKNARGYQKSGGPTPTLKWHIPADSHFGNHNAAPAPTVAGDYRRSD